MIGVEQIVRPVATADPLSRRRIVASADKVEVEPATLIWGAVGTLAAPHKIDAAGGVSFTVLDCDDEYEEISRESETVRITQIDEDGNEVPENFVDVDRPRKVKFDKISERDRYYLKTTTWKTAIESAVFVTTNINDKKCYATYRFTSTIPPAG